MMILMKAIPLAMMTAGVMASADKLKPILMATQTTATQFEVNEITKMIKLDYISAPDQLPTAENFGEYLKKNMRVQDPTHADRDVAADQWGTAYKFEREDTVVRVISAGPDKAFGTDDDVYSRRKLD